MKDNHWGIPNRLKVHEALSVLADNRIEVSDNTAKVYSSTRNKFYQVSYDSETSSIMSNDNSAYWVNQISYPMIAFLLTKGVISTELDNLDVFKNIFSWKDINQQCKNDYALAEAEFKKIIEERGFNIDEINLHIDQIYSQVKNLKLSKLGKKIHPPVGY